MIALLDCGTSGHQGRGVAQPGLARLPWEQEVGSSNLLAPTILKMICFLLFIDIAPVAQMDRATDF